MGKAKRFNPYDESVAEKRKLVQSYGEARQKLSITSSFGNPPLEPPIATSTASTGGTGDGKFLTVSLAADQTANIAVNNHIEFDTKDEDGDIVLQTGAGQSDGLFELESGKKYYLQVSLRPEFSGSTGQLEVAWFDQTNTVEIGSRAKYEAQDHSGSDANQPTASAIVTPATNIIAKVEILSVTALDGFANEYCHANLFEIALGGAGAGGGGGSSGVTFPITPSINDHGNVGTVTEDIDIGASTGHVHKLTLTGNPTLTFSNPPSSGTQMEFEIEFVQDATGGRTVTHPASVAETVVISSVASATTIITYRTNDGGTTYHAIPALRGSINLSGSFANQELANLGTVAINTSLISDTDNQDDLGSATKEWKDLFIDGTANIDAISLTGGITWDDGDVISTSPTEWILNSPTGTTQKYRINSVDKLTIDTAQVKLQGTTELDLTDNNIVNVKNLRFLNTGADDVGTVNIWSDASGDMVFNAAATDAFFWTLGGGSATMALSENALQLQRRDADGLFGLDFTLPDDPTADLDAIGQIRFRAVEEDDTTTITYARISAFISDATAGTSGGSLAIFCRTSDTEATKYIDINALDNNFIAMKENTLFEKLVDFKGTVDMTGQILDGLGVVTAHTSTDFEFNCDSGQTYIFDINDFPQLTIVAQGIFVGDVSTNTYDGNSTGQLFGVATGDRFFFKVNATNELQIIEGSGIVIGNAGDGNNIDGTTDGLTYDVATGDDHDFQVNSVDIVTIASNGLTIPNEFISLQDCILNEISTPTGTTNDVHLYADNGGSGGKTRLMAIFQTGAAQVVASEP